MNAFSVRLSSRLEMIAPSTAVSERCRSGCSLIFCSAYRRSAISRSSARFISVLAVARALTLYTSSSWDRFSAFWRWFRSVISRTKSCEPTTFPPRMIAEELTSTSIQRPSFLRNLPSNFS